jgi:hypothetical protein
MCDQKGSNRHPFCSFDVKKEFCCKMSKKLFQFSYIKVANHLVRYLVELLLRDFHHRLADTVLACYRIGSD